MTDNLKNNNHQEIKSNYIKEEQFEKIRQCQAIIFEQTQISTKRKNNY